MRVGGVQETITVTGETPVVDVQTSTRTQKVIDNEVIAALPASRGYGNILATVPGIQATGLNSGANPVMNFFTARGGRGNEGTVQIDGMNVGSAFNGGGVAGFGYDTANAHGNPGHHRGRPRRNRSRRPGVQHDSAHRRQQLQRHLLPQLRRRVGAGEQPRRRVAELRHHRGAGAHQELGHQLRAGRPDRARQAVVLRQRAHLRFGEPTFRASTATRTPGTRTR